MIRDRSSLPLEVSHFVAQSPLNRSHIAAFVAAAAAEAPAGSHVLDAGAGAAPYRSLFAHTRYVTSDWTGSVHAEALGSDIVAPVEQLPVDNGSFDLVLATEVLEHVRDAGAALQELHRVLAPGGRLWLTTPFVWELHEEPHDFARYTSHALEQLMAAAGFEQVRVTPVGGWFSVLGQLLRNFGSITGRSGPKASWGTRALIQVLARCGSFVARFDAADRRRGLPLGYTTVGTKPAG